MAAPFAPRALHATLAALWLVALLRTDPTLANLRESGTAAARGDLAELAADDECAADGEPCALQALQRRLSRRQAVMSAVQTTAVETLPADVPPTASGGAVPENASDLGAPVDGETGISCTPSYHHNCKANPVCCDPAATCYEKDEAVAVCLLACAPGIHSNDKPEYQTPWSCKVIKAESAPAPASQPAATPIAGPPPAKAPNCMQSYTANCRGNPVCCDPTATCYEKDQWTAVCLRSCSPGIHDNDPVEFQTPWTCEVVGAALPAPAQTAGPPQAAEPLPALVPSVAPPGPEQEMPDGPCTMSYLYNCREHPVCCDPTATCYEKDATLAVCMKSCTPGIHAGDITGNSPWTCQVLSPAKVTDATSTTTAAISTTTTTTTPATTTSTTTTTTTITTTSTSTTTTTPEPTSVTTTVAADLVTIPPTTTSTTTTTTPTTTTTTTTTSTTTMTTTTTTTTTALPPAPAQSPTCTPLYTQNCMYNPTCCDPKALCYAKDEAVALCLLECKPGLNAQDPPEYRTPWACDRVMAPAPAPLPTPAPPPPSALTLPSKGDLLTFYMYRAQSNYNYKLQNINAGNLAGVMWYLQNEIVSGGWGGDTNRFGISRILRFKVQMRATQPLLDRGMNFGVRVAFDSGKCTGPTCDFDWTTYGYNVGCNKLGEWPFPQFNTHYPGPVWYSLPGECPSASYLNKDAGCRQLQPGGLCFGKTPTGAGDCTWTYDFAGELQLSELYGSTPRHVWWASSKDDAWNARRVQAAASLFAAKYGPDPPAPPCDFNKDRFYGDNKR